MAVTKMLLYQPAETLTHRRHCPCRARRQYPIGSVYVFAMDVPVGRRQDESGSASFGISPGFGVKLSAIILAGRTRAASWRRGTHELVFARLPSACRCSRPLDRASLPNRFSDKARETFPCVE